MEQPPLDRHCAVLHLGGAKRINRRGGGQPISVDAKTAAITSTPVGATHSWSTQGPIAFAHLYIDPATIARTVQERFDRDPRNFEMLGCVGAEAPLLATLFNGMLGEVERPGLASRLVLDTLLQSFVVQLVCRHSTLAAAIESTPHSLPPRRMRRVLEYIEANLADDLELDDLASIAGSSRFHFSRAFRDATGFPPYRYLVHRRIKAAKAMLLESELPIEEIASACGFKSAAQFSAMFKQVFGATPNRFRREN